MGCLQSVRGIQVRPPVIFDKESLATSSLAFDFDETINNETI